MAPRVADVLAIGASIAKLRVKPVREHEANAPSDALSDLRRVEILGRDPREKQAGGPGPVAKPKSTKYALEPTAPYCPLSPE